MRSHLVVVEAVATRDEPRGRAVSSSRAVGRFGLS